MIRLACPVCQASLKHDCHSSDCCQSFRPELARDIPDLVPSSLLLESSYRFEFARYEVIAEAGPERYSGYADSRPERRAALMASMLRWAKVGEFVNVGPGFGPLEAVTEDLARVAVDSCLGFLRRIKARHPAVRCVRGVAERLPLATGSVPCLVADSVFQSIVDREAFLYEVARVCGPGAWLFLTVACAWNYPRRPQNGFDVSRADERQTLFRFLEEMGFKIKTRHMDIAAGRWSEEGDYLYIVGRKT